jgi:hypothetical protein
MMRKLRARSMLELARIHETLQARGEWQDGVPNSSSANVSGVPSASVDSARA